jgi:hypothetical protein
MWKPLDITSGNVQWPEIHGVCVEEDYKRVVQGEWRVYSYCGRAAR